MIISNLMVQLGTHAENAVEEDLLRHFVLNSIRSYNKKFKDKYGEMIIACDDRLNWRRTVFPFYKANRKRDREKSKINWDIVFRFLDTIKAELKEYFPYRVIQIEGCEADDVIGTLCMEYGNTNEKILIISGDKDFRQLQSFLNVQQYDPVKSKMIVENDPEKYLKEHIIRGDKGDGVPNFLSDDDSFILNKRQKSITTKSLEKWLTQSIDEICGDDNDLKKKYQRNKEMVDLTMIPNGYQKAILEEYNNQANKPRTKLYNYFVHFKLKNLLTDIQEF